MSGAHTGGDPRIDAAPADDVTLVAMDDEPVVGREIAPINPALIFAGFAIFAILLFVWLNGRRTQADLALVAPVPPAQAAAAAQLPPPLVMPVSAPGPDGPPGPFSGLPPQVAYVPPVAPAPPPPPFAASVAGVPASATAPAGGSQRRRAPSLVVDLGAGPGERVLAQAGAAPGPLGAAVAAGAEGGAGAGPRLNDSEQFARRVGDEPTEQVRAVSMRNPARIVPQGAMIPGVLESAINSDLPGYTRAIVSRDVLSFDGKSVLIPRSSRLIGQYKSAVALGQSRAFIIWTRVIRPDGVSVQIGSPGTDALGRGGLDGEVNRHFFRRFSGSILLSVLNAGVAAIGTQPSTQISIGSPAAAQGLANTAMQGDSISPTIKVKQGEAILIFVSRDLDFSGVEAVR